MARGNFGVVQDPLKFFENGRGDQDLELFGAPGIKHLPGSTLSPITIPNRLGVLAQRLRPMQCDGYY
jgi:hypothetical protein